MGHSEPTSFAVETCIIVPRHVELRVTLISSRLLVLPPSPLLTIHLLPPSTTAFPPESSNLSFVIDLIRISCRPAFFFVHEVSYEGLVAIIKIKW